MAVERIVPDTPEWTAHYANHIQRYAFAAARVVAGSRVLDAACGSGYGSHYLAEHGAATVVGVDQDETLLGNARRKFSHPAVAFVHDDCCELRNPQIRGPFDVVISLETLEHLSCPETFLTRCHSLMAPRGLLIVSTPNALKESGGRSNNEFHLREYSAIELARLLCETGFEPSQFYGQFDTAVGRIRNELREELHKIRGNSAVRVGAWLQWVLRGIKQQPLLPERLEDFEITPLRSPEECDALGMEGPFSLICVARSRG